MGLLDDLVKQTQGGGPALGGLQGGGALAGLMGLATGNPQILAAVVGLLGAGGGIGGLGGLISAFQKKGLGDMVSSWISNGPNPPLSAAQVTDVLGADTMGAFATKAGVPTAEAGSLLAGLLPNVIDKLTPDGKLPDAGVLEGMLGSLLPKFG